MKRFWRMWKSHLVSVPMAFMASGVICTGAWFGWRHQEVSAIEHKQPSVTGITEALRITKADGIKSIGQLIRELPPDSGPIPDQAIKSFHFFVDPFNDALIFPAVPGFQPEQFQWGILPGQDKQFTIPKIELTAPEGLNFYLVKTNGTCNFLLIMEFYPKEK